MALGDRRGRGGSKLGRGAGRSNSVPGGDAGDVTMRDASNGAGPTRRTRSSASAGARSGPGGRPSGPYQSRPGGRSPLADRVRGGNRPALLKDAASKGAVEVLKELVKARWNADAGLLNLENLAGDAIFATAKIKPPGHKQAPKNAAPALWKLASENCPNLQSISLAQNNLSTLVDLAPAALIKFLPKVKNLSLEGNSISQYADLNPLSTVVGAITGSKPGLGELQELILTGNPLQVRETNKSSSDYHNEMRRRFPSLTMLDMVPIDQTIPIPKVDPHATKSVTDSKRPLNIAGRAIREQTSKIGHEKGRPTKVSAPLPVGPAFSDSDASQNAMSAFLVKYFGVFDSNRTQLHLAYTPTATFSLSVNTSVSERARKLQNLQPEDVTKLKGLSWSRYLGASYEAGSKIAGQAEENLSRNFLRTKNAGRREATLHVGPKAILRLFAKLPQTSHPLHDSAKFVVDTWQQPGTSSEFPDTLFVSVHGEYIEHPVLGPRSFDRTFILAPTPAGTPAASAGWPCVILADMLVIRNWTNPDSMRPASKETAAGQAGPTGTAAGQVAPALPPLNESQQALMAQLHASSGLNAQFCYQCLNETGWDYNAAMQAFQAARASIPPEAFAQSG